VTVVSVSMEIDAPPERVWEVISNPANLPHWDRHVVRVHGIPATGLEEGSTYLTEMRFFSVRANVFGEVLEWDPPRRSAIRLTGLLDATVTSTVLSLGEGRSLLEHVVEYRFRGGPFGDLAARSLRLVGGPQYALRRGTLAQKHEIETGRRSG
jgi:hypothetical protein